MSLTVREADFPRDAEAVTEGATDFVARMNCPDIVGSDMKPIQDGIAFLLGLPSFELWVVDDGTRVAGGAGLLFAPFPWNRAKSIMSEQFIWCAKDAPQTAFLSLIRHIEGRRQAMNAIGELFDLTSSPSGIGDIYTRFGYRPVQRSWMKAA